MKVILLLAFVFFKNSDAALTAAELCASAPSNTFVGDPNDCSQWYYCDNGAVGNWGTCPDGQNFNAKKGACQFSNTFTCYDSSNICANGASGYYADPDDCASYVYCKGGVAEYGSCPEGQIYMADTVSCGWLTGENTCNTATICQFVKDGTFVANPNGCNQYYYCSGGLGTSGSCAEGYYFNSKGQSCNENVNNVCPAAGLPKDAIVPCTGSTSEEWFNSPTNCNEYFYCPPNSPTTDNALGPIQCPPKFHFTTINSKSFCAPSYSVINYDSSGELLCSNRCGGYATGFVVNTNSSTSNCEYYLFCQNGRVMLDANGNPYAPGQCPDKAGIFNENTQSCGNTEPEGSFCT